MATLEVRLSKVRNPNQQNQKQAAVVLSAVEETLGEQGTSEFTPTAYFAALLALLPQSISQTNILDSTIASPILYLLDIITPFCPSPLLQSKFNQIVVHLAPAFTNPDAGAPLLKAGIGCLESLLLSQDGTAWAVPQKDVSPRRALAGLLNLGVDDRPKVRKRAQEAITKVLKNPPPSPSLNHPAAEMCAVTVLRSVVDLAAAGTTSSKGQHDPRLIHAIQLMHAVSKGGWPSTKIESLVEALLNISRSNNEFLTMAVFDVFDTIFKDGLTEIKSAKLSRVIDAISGLCPSHNDSQLLPPWLGVISQGYSAYSTVSPNSAFATLPSIYTRISTYLESSAHDIRISCSMCLISLINNCIPNSLILPSSPSSQELAQIAHTTTNLLSLKYQGAWMEVFEIITTLFDKLRWKSCTVMDDIVRIVGDLRSNDGFQGKKEADILLGHAVAAMGPIAVLEILPLNMVRQKIGQSGRAWLLPILRDHTANTSLTHFLSEMLPICVAMSERISAYGSAEKTNEINALEMIIRQVWSILPGYCTAPLDLREAFDRPFAELLSNKLYEQSDLRPDICRALQLLVESNQAVLSTELNQDGQEDLLLQHRITKTDARKNITLLASFAPNLLLVLFNTYSKTLPQYRGYILDSINAYLSITPLDALMETFAKVTSLLEGSITESAALPQAEKEKKGSADSMPSVAHSLMDLVITISPYLPTESYTQLLAIFALLINKKDDPQLQKKAYKIIPRLARSESGKQVLSERVNDLQKVLLESAETATAPARRDRLEAIANIIEYLPTTDLYFIPSILPEVVISCKEVNERARTATFDLLVSMGEKMKVGGTIVSSHIHGMSTDSPNVNATLEEYFTMASAGLAGSTPHMISASITALARILFQFKDELQTEFINEMVTTMDLFLTSKNREIVRSVLGFVKVCIISLPKDIMITKLPTLIPNLMVWSHEHRAHFKTKVKHMLERAIRRFGYETVEKFMPEESKRLISHIRKTRDRSKRQKEEQKKLEGNEEGDTKPGKQHRHFNSRFEEAIYDSENDEMSEGSDTEMAGAGAGVKRGQQYIIEDDDEPLDLLDTRSLAHISSTRPIKPRPRPMNKSMLNSKFNEAGKLVIGEDSEDEIAGGEDEDVVGIGNAVSAYVQAISSKHAVQKGQRNRIKFHRNKKGIKDDEDDEMEDVDARPREKSNKGGHQPLPPQKTPKKRDGHGVRSVRGGRVHKGRGGPKGGPNGGRVHKSRQ